MQLPVFVPAESDVSDQAAGLRPADHRGGGGSRSEGRETRGVEGADHRPSSSSVGAHRLPPY